MLDEAMPAAGSLPDTYPPTSASMHETSTYRDVEIGWIGSAFRIIVTRESRVQELSQDHSVEEHLDLVDVRGDVRRDLIDVE